MVSSEEFLVKTPAFLVDYGHAEIYATGVFSVETGELLNFVYYGDYTEGF